MPTQTAGRIPPNGADIGDSWFFQDTATEYLWDGGRWVPPGIAPVAPLGVGYAYTGTKPATVAGAGTSAGTFWSVVAPNGGDSSGAAGGAGGGLTLTTGSGGSSVSTGAKGGDFTITLGPGSGTGPSGQLIILSNETGTDNSGGTANNTVRIFPTITPGAAGGIQAYQGLYIFQVMSGIGSRYGTFTAAGEFWNVVRSSGTTTGPVYGAEGTVNLDLAGATLTQGTGLQGNVIMSIAGTISTGTAVTGDFQVIGGGVVTVAQGFNVAQTASNAAIYTTIYGYRCIGLWNDSAVSSGTSTVGGYNAYAAQFGVPIQGGNTSGTNNNTAVYVLSQASGGGTQVAGGVVNNWGVFIDRITNVASNNYGMQVKRHGATSSTIGSLSNFGVSVEQPIGAGNTTGTINNYGFHSAQVGTSGTSTAGGNVNNYGYYGDVPTGAAGTGGSVVVNYGFRIAGNGGTATNWAIYSSSTANSTLLGSLAIGSNTAAVGTGALAVEGLLARYNAVATAGWGLPAIYTDTRPGTKSNVTTTIATYTVGAADGTFEIAANINVTVSTTVTMTVTCAYTDEANVARTLTLPFFLLAGTLVQSITTAQGNIAYASMPIYIRCKAATTITLATAGTVTAVTYTSEGTIKQVA